MSKHSFTSRTKARKRAADVIFEADQRGMGRNPQVLEDLLRERKVVTAALTPLPEYSQTIVAGVASDLRRIDDLIAEHARVNGLDRMPAVDFAVLRVATWEMLDNADDVPRVIAIDEAVSIVKSISTDSSPAFVNAVLDAVRRDIESPAWRREHVIEDQDLVEAGTDAEEDSSDEVAESADVDDVAEVPSTNADEADDFAVDSQEPAEPEPVYSEAESAEAEADSNALAKENTARAKHPTVEDLTNADLDELDELLDEY